MPNVVKIEFVGLHFEKLQITYIERNDPTNERTNQQTNQQTNSREKYLLRGGKYYDDEFMSIPGIQRYST